MDGRSSSEPDSPVDSSRISEVGYTTLRGVGNKPPVFWITPDPGQSKVLFALGDDRPVYLLRGPKSRVDQPPMTLVEMARCYAATIRRLRPSGPYVLVGYCVAATVAREIAGLLASDGLDVDRVVMIDPPDPAETRGRFQADPLWYRTRFMFSRVRFHGERLVRLGVRERADYLRSSLREISRRLAYARTRRQHDDARRPGAELPAALTDNYFASVAAFQNGVPERTSVPIILLRPTGVPRGAFDFANRRWSALCDAAFTVAEVQGDSRSMWSGDGASTICAFVDDR